jgi:hypothetical protein
VCVFTPPDGSTQFGPPPFSMWRRTGRGVSGSRGLDIVRSGPLNSRRDRRSQFELGSAQGSGELRPGALRRLAQFDLPDVDAVRIADRQAVFSQPFEMQGKRLPDELLSLRARRASLDYAREVGTKALHPVAVCSYTTVQVCPTGLLRKTGSAENAPQG